jgi:glutamate dehydrogenase/leucine dehydrogenase
MPGTDLFERFADELGPAKIVHVYDPGAGLKGIVVIDNVARGPAIGGIRLAPGLDVDEIFRLARTMTFKNAAAGLPHGGAKAGILGDPHLVDKNALLRSFARRIRELTDFIPGPDMGTDESCMGFVQDEIGRCVGRPRALGGIPLDEIGATGYGLSHVARLALPFAGLEPAGTTMAIQGFGHVGRHAAHFLARLGMKLVAASDSSGTICHEAGIDVATLSRVKQETGSVLDYPEGTKLDRDAILQLPCEVLIPAARPDVITVENTGKVRSKLILEGANIPLSEEAERILHDRGVLCIPDFIANAGGVVCAAVEYAGGSERQAMATIREKLTSNTRALLDLMSREKLYPRQAALRLAYRRVKEAMAFRR